MDSKCTKKVGKTQCKEKYYSSGYCKYHYLDKFKNNKKRFGKFGSKVRFENAKKRL